MYIQGLFPFLFRESEPQDCDCDCDSDWGDHDRKVDPFKQGQVEGALAMAMEPHPTFIIKQVSQKTFVIASVPGAGLNHSLSRLHRFFFFFPFLTVQPHLSKSETSR